jgi:rhamnosyl/mannosyltransferase
MTDTPDHDGDLHVLQVCTYYYPFTGGIQRLVRSLVTGIEDVESRIVTAETRGLGGVDEKHDTTVVRASTLGELKSMPISPTFPYRVRQQLEWADLIHYHVPFPLAPISHLLTVDDTPSVATFHDDIIGKGPIVYPYRPILDRFLRSMDRILVTSPNMREYCDCLTGHEDRTTVVPIGVEATDADIEPRTPSGRRVLFVGRLVEFKGVDYLISAMRHLDAELSVVGTGPARDALEAHATAEGVADAVTFEGFVSEERLDALYDAADVFVLPSAGANESFGIVQLEAMQRGLPVVNTDLPTGVPYVSVDGQTGYTVAPADASAIAAAVTDLFEDPETYREFSANAQRRVRSTFTESRMLRDTRDVYRAVAASE